MATRLGAVILKRMQVGMPERSPGRAALIMVDLYWPVLPANQPGARGTNPSATTLHARLD